MFKSVDDITRNFIENGWNADTSFRELTLMEAIENGLLFAIERLQSGKKIFVMNICNNIYDDNGNLLYYGNLKVIEQ